MTQAELIKRVAVAKDTDGTARYEAAQGVLVEREGATLRAVATDGYRLFIAEHTNGYSGENKVELVDLPEGVSAKPQEFPNWHTVIPDWYKLKVSEWRSFVVDRDALIYAVKLAVLMANPHSYGISLTLSDKPLVVRGEHPEYGEGETSLAILPAKEGGSGPMTAGFNAYYLLDFLKSAARGPIAIRMREQAGSEFRPLAEEDCRVVYYLMPMRM